MFGDEKERTAIKVLHVGPDMSAQGGIASVLAAYSMSKTLFNSFGCELVFCGTCGRTGIKRVFGFVSAWWKIAHSAARGRVDIVHIHTSIRGSLLRKLLLATTCLVLRQKYVVHLHSGAMEPYLERLPTTIRAAVKFVWKRAARVICLSRAMQAWLTARWGFETANCPLVYNGISEPSLRVRTGDVIGAPPVIVFLGKLLDAKGVFVLLEAVEQLKTLGHSFRLLVGGNGNVEAFRNEIERRGVADEVEYLGWIAGDAKTHLLEDADIFVLPSRSEGFPVAIVEAMAFSAAIVSTNIPGVVDAVTHEREGLLVPPDDADALAGALSLLISSPALRAQLSEAARRRFLDRFTIQRTVEQLVHVYGGIMK